MNRATTVPAYGGEGAFTRGCRTNPNRADRSLSPHGLTIRAPSAPSAPRSSCKPPAQPLQSLSEHP
jgi:hypothetical protein